MEKRCCFLSSKPPQDRFFKHRRLWLVFKKFSFTPPPIFTPPPLLRLFYFHFLFFSEGLGIPIELAALKSPLSHLFLRFIFLSLPPPSPPLCPSLDIFVSAVVCFLFLEIQFQFRSVILFVNICMGREEVSSVRLYLFALSGILFFEISIPSPQDTVRSSNHSLYPP